MTGVWWATRKSDYIVNHRRRIGVANGEIRPFVFIPGERPVDWAGGKIVENGPLIIGIPYRRDVVGNGRGAINMQIDSPPL